MSSKNNKSTFHGVSYALIAGAVLALTACGGGGVSSTSATAAVSSFSQIKPAQNFSWSTSTSTAPSITLTRSSAAALGPVTLLVSAYTCADPTSAGGTLTYPQRTDVYTSYPLNLTQQAQTSVTVSSQATPPLTLQIPAATTKLLVEVTQGSLTLYSQLVTPLALGSLSIAFPDSPPDSRNTALAASCN